MDKRNLDLKNIAFHKPPDKDYSQRELFLRTILEALPVACYVVDDHRGEILYFNSLFCDIWGAGHLENGMRNGTLKTGDIMRHCLNLVADVSEYTESRMPLQDANNRSTIHDEIELKDGRIINRLSTQLRDVNNNYLGRLFVFGDITRPKQIERSLKESEKRLQEFARAMSDTGFIIDEDGRYVEVFGDNQKLLPVSNEILKGHIMHQLLDKEMADTMLSEIRRTIATGRQRSLVFDLDLGKERKLTVEGRSAPMSYLVDGKKTVAVSLTNISERRKVEKMLQMAYNLQRKSDFFNNLINNHSTMNKQASATAKMWGIDLSCPLFCCLINIEEATFLNKNGDNNHIDFHYLKNNIIALLSDYEEYVLWDNRDKIGILCQAVDTADEWVISMQAAKLIRDRISCLAAGLVITIGVGHMHSGLRGLEKSYHEAGSAVAAARCQKEKIGSIVHYQDIGLYQLIAACEIEHTREYVQKKIGPLLNYDREKGTGFLHTLEVILQSNNLKDAAKKIFLHHKTLAYRKKRIEEILGVSIDHFETRLALAAAIKLHKLNSLKEK